MAHLIVLIQPKDKRWYVQIGDSDDHQAFNLHFSMQTIKDVLDGFSIPTLGPEPVWNIYGDRYSETIAHVTKVMPKVAQVSEVMQFLALLAKKFKVNAYQINVNSNFDWSNLQPWDKDAPFVIGKDLRRAGSTLELY